MPIYTVIRGHTSDEVQGYPIGPGAVIKFGRIEFMVIEVRNNSEQLSLRDTAHFKSASEEVFEVSGSVEEGRTCKICLCEEETPENRLISPCNCKGSCEGIHMECLQKWINSKVRKELQGIATSYNFTKFECEICKAPFPKVLSLNGRQHEMMTIVKPDKPYLILESLPSEAERQEERLEKSLHVITAPEESKHISIGRGQTSEIKITDISVSRTHAEIFFEKNKFFVADMGSKFGTLVRFDEQMELIRERPIKIQCGRSMFEFSLAP